MDYRDIYYEVVSGSSLVSNIISIAFAVLMIVALWKIYEKAGEHGWAAIVPFYRSYVLYKISGKKNLFWGNLAASIVAVIAYIILLVEIFALIFSGLSGFFSTSYMDRELRKHGAGLFVCLLLLMACLIAMLVFRIIQCIGLAKNFGVSGGYAVGLIFLPHIFYCIFAFSSNFVYTAGAPKYGNGLYGVPNGFPPQNGGQPPVYMNPYSGQPQPNPQPPVFINPYSAQPGYGQPLQPNYTVQPGYGQPQQQNYAARPDLQPTGYVNPYVQPQQPGAAGQTGYTQPGVAGQTGYTQPQQPEAAVQNGNMQTQIPEEQTSGGDQGQS